MPTFFAEIYSGVGCFSCASELEVNLSGTHISLKQLTLKTVMLLAVLSGQRVQTLAVLSTTNISLTNDSVQYYIDKLLKQSRPGKTFRIITKPLI